MLMYLFNTSPNKHQIKNLSITSSTPYYNVNILEQQDEQNLRVRLNVSVFTYNYVYLDTLGRFYYVSDRVYVRQNLIELKLTEDVLSNFAHCVRGRIDRTNIDLYKNLSIEDNAVVFTPKKSITFPQPIYDTGDSNPFSYAGTFVITTTGNNNVVTPGGSTVTKANFGETGFLNIALTDEYDDVYKTQQELWDPDIIAQITGTQAQKFDAIVNLGFLPVKINFLSDVANRGSIYVGNIKLDTTWKRKANSQFVNFNLGHFNNPLYSNGDLQTQFWKYEPYSKLEIYLPFYGVKQLKLTDWTNYPNIYLGATLDLYTGDMTYYIGARTMVYTGMDTTQNINVDLAIDRVTTNIMSKLVFSGGDYSKAIGSVMGGAAAAIAGVATDNPIMALGGIAAALGGSVQTFGGGATPRKAGDLAGGSGYKGKSGGAYQAHLIWTTPTDAPTVTMNTGWKGNDKYTINDVRDTMDQQTYTNFIQFTDCYIVGNSSYFSVQAPLMTEGEAETLLNIMQSPIYGNRTT